MECADWPGLAHVSAQTTWPACRTWFLFKETKAAVCQKQGTDSEQTKPTCPGDKTSEATLSPIPLAENLEPFEASPGGHCRYSCLLCG